MRKDKKHGMNIGSVFELGKPLPVFLFLSLSFTFLWAVIPWVPLLGVVVCLIYTLKVGLAHHIFGVQRNASHTERSDMEGFWLTCLTSVLAVALGTLTGLYAYEAYISLFYTVAMGAPYGAVLATTPAAAFGDAGMLMFAPTSTVNTQYAVGYRDKHTFCAAPIMDSGPQQTRSIGFWAIGFDCCSARGTFECGSAGNSTAHGGIRAPPDGILDRSHADFMRAIRQAAAVYDIVPQDDLVLVHWSITPKQEQWRALAKAFGVNALGLGLFCLLVLVMAVGSTWSGDSPTEAAAEDP